MSDHIGHPLAIQALCREATNCRACFDQGKIAAATIDIAQPRWIADGYWTSSPRVCAVSLNPAAGTDRNHEANLQMQTLLQRLRAGAAELDEVFQVQRADFPNWGRARGRFNPDVVILSGKKTYRYAIEVARRDTNVRVFPTLHFAHREGLEAELGEARRFRQFLAHR